MTTANIHYAKTNLSKLLEKIANGEEVIIAKSGKPVALLSPYVKKKKERKLGTMAGQLEMAPDFDELPEEFMKHFT